jgi:hypothetical protein
MGVSLAGAGAPAAIQNSQVRVYPSVKRAMAATASSKTDDQSVDYVEMMLQDLDAQKGTTAGIIDLPGAAQALTFQSVPGKSSFYARLDISPKLVFPPLESMALTQFVTPGLVSPLPPLPVTIGPGTTPPVSITPVAAPRSSSAYWPAMANRSASQALPPDISNLPSSVVHIGPAQPSKPSQADIDAWKALVRSTLATAVQAAAAAGTPIDPRFIHVHD